jgi:hypothetical protein
MADWLNESHRALVIIDDVRFHEEIDYIRANNGIVIYIESDPKTADPHISENAITAADCDYQLFNVGTVADLCAGYRSLVTSHYSHKGAEDGQ